MQDRFLGDAGTPARHVFLLTGDEGPPPAVTRTPTALQSPGTWAVTTPARAVLRSVLDSRGADRERGWRARRVLLIGPAQHLAQQERDVQA